MTFMLEQHLLQMAATRDPSWIAMCDGFKHGTRDDCRWHRLAGRPTWSAGLARSRGRQVDGDGRVEVNLMSAALLLVSESVLATARARGWQRLAGRDDRRHDESEEDRARRAERVLELVRDGEISRAMRLLHSLGIAGVTEDI